MFFSSYCMAVIMHLQEALFFLRVWFPHYIQKTQSARKYSDSWIFLRFILWCSMSFSSDCIVNASVLTAYPKDGCFLHFDQLWLAAMISSAKRKTFIFFKIFHFFSDSFCRKEGSIHRFFDEWWELQLFFDIRKQ